MLNTKPRFRRGGACGTPSAAKGRFRMRRSKLLPVALSAIASWSACSGESTSDTPTTKPDSGADASSGGAAGVAGGSGGAAGANTGGSAAFGLTTGWDAGPDVIYVDGGAECDAGTLPPGSKEVRTCCGDVGTCNGYCAILPTSASPQCYCPGAPPGGCPSPMSCCPSKAFGCAAPEKCIGGLP